MAGAQPYGLRTTDYGHSHLKGCISPSGVAIYGSSYACWDPRPTAPAPSRRLPLGGRRAERRLAPSSHILPRSVFPFTLSPLPLLSPSLTPHTHPRFKPASRQPPRHPDTLRLVVLFIRGAEPWCRRGPAGPRSRGQPAPDSDPEARGERHAFSCSYTAAYIVYACTRVPLPLFFKYRFALIRSYTAMLFHYIHG
jgi:hypothetical protein